MQRRKKLFLILMLGIFIFTGCSTKPIYYSESDVKDYVKSVFGKEYNLINTSLDKDEENHNTRYNYTFENSEGFSFTVRTYADHVQSISGDTVFYEKCIDNNYTEAVLAKKKESIEETLQGVSFEYQFTDFGLLFELENYDMLAEATDMAAKIDEIVAFNYDNEAAKKYSYSNEYSVSFSLKPNNPNCHQYADNKWKSAISCSLGSIDMSNNEEERIKADEVYEKLERALVYDIRRSIDDPEAPYTLPDEILYKYEAEFLQLDLDVPEEYPYSYTFKYDEKLDSYWIYCLDPCQNFEGVYNYSDMGAFQGLVEYLGGTYTCDEWEAEWSIGDNIWQADLIVVDSQYDNFIIRKNGQKLILDEPYGKSNGTTSGRAFSIADLEQLLGITLQDDQRTATLTPLISIIVPKK